MVAHSASGLLLLSISAELGAQHQVWLAAAVAGYAGGRSLPDEARSGPSAMFNPERVGADPITDPVLATYFPFHDCDLRLGARRRCVWRSARP